MATSLLSAEPSGQGMSVAESFSKTLRKENADSSRQWLSPHLSGTTGHHPDDSKPGDANGAHHGQISPVRQYLTSALGCALASCMAELCTQFPQDPIDFIAHWLYRYADFVIYKQEKAGFLQRAASLAKALARERKLRKQRMLNAMKNYAELKETLFELSPAQFKAAFAQSGQLLRPHRNQEVLAKDAFYDQVMTSLSPSERSQMDYRHMQSERRTSRKKSRLHQKSSLVAGRSGDGSLRQTSSDYPSSGASSKSRKKRSRYGEHDGDYEDEESDDASTQDSKVSPRDTEAKKKRKMRLTPKDSLTAPKKWHSRESARDAYWKYQFPPGLIVCVHPLLGKMVAKGPIRHAMEMEQWFEEESPCQSLYSHEIYVCLPEQMLYVAPEHVSSEHESESATEEMEKSAIDAKTSLELTENKEGRKTPDHVSAEHESESAREAMGIDAMTSLELANNKEGCKPDFTKAILNDHVVEKESEGVDVEKPQANERVEDREDDDPRWQVCTGDEVCEGWRLCEGFCQDPQEGDDTQSSEVKRDDEN